MDAEPKRKRRWYQFSVPLTTATITSIATFLVSCLILWLSMPYPVIYAIIASDWILNLTLGRLVGPGGHLFGGFLRVLSMVGIFAYFAIAVAVARRCCTIAVAFAAHQRPTR
jgi:hypothetical protein